MSEVGGVGAELWKGDGASENTELTLFRGPNGACIGVDGVDIAGDGVEGTRDAALFCMTQFSEFGGGQTPPPPPLVALASGNSAEDAAAIWGVFSSLLSGLD